MCLEAIKELIIDSGLNSESKDELAYDYSTASAYITEWVKHILRGVHTQSTKKKIIEMLSETNAMVLGDWMMKIIPQKIQRENGGVVR